MRSLHFRVFTVLILTTASAAFAADWPNWRGPHHNGTTSDAPLPSGIDLATDIVWETALPGDSSATPIVSGDRVFVVSNNENALEIYGICIDNNTGQILWQKLLDKVDSVPTRNTMASCSPVTDGETVWMMSGSGPLYAFDFAGNEKWRKNMAEEYGGLGQQFGYSSTPLLMDGKLYFPVLRGQWEKSRDWDSYTDDNSHIVCLDAATGEEVWKVHRPSDAKGESFDSYASAVPYQAESGPAIIVQGGDHLTAHDAATGEELWRQEHNPRKARNWRLIPSPVVAGDVVIGLEPRGGAAFGILPGQQKQLSYEESTWIYESPTGDVPTPAVVGDNVYIINDTRHKLICLDARTGEERWQEDLNASARIWSSPTIGDGKMYYVDENGQVTIAQVEPAFKLLAQVDFGGRVTKSSVALANGSVYVRTAERLVRAGGKN